MQTYAEFKKSKGLPRNTTEAKHLTEAEALETDKKLNPEYRKIVHDALLQFDPKIPEQLEERYKQALGKDDPESPVCYRNMRSEITALIEKDRKNPASSAEFAKAVTDIRKRVDDEQLSLWEAKIGKQAQLSNIKDAQVKNATVSPELQEVWNRIEKEKAVNPTPMLQSEQVTQLDPKKTAKKQ